MDLGSKVIFVLKIRVGMASIREGRYQEKSQWVEIQGECVTAPP